MCAFQINQGYNNGLDPTTYAIQQQDCLIFTSEPSAKACLLKF